MKPLNFIFFFFQAEDGIRDVAVTGVQTCALPIWRRGVNLPVVFLTGHALTVNESLAFDCGAIDFIDKARGVEVVVRRLRRVVDTARSAAQPNSEKLLVRGKLVLKPSISRATWGDVDVGLTVGEY